MQYIFSFSTQLSWRWLVAQMQPGAFESHCCHEAVCFWTAGWTLPVKVQHPALWGGCGCMEGRRRYSGARNALEWQPSWLWWEQGSMASARLGAFREPRENAYGKCEEISIINRNAQDREMKAEHRNWKIFFQIQEWSQKKTLEAIWKDFFTKCALCLNS